MTQNATRTVLVLSQRMRVAKSTAHDALAIVGRSVGAAIVGILVTGLLSAMVAWMLSMIAPAIPFRGLMFVFPLFAAAFALSVLAIPDDSPLGRIVTDDTGDIKVYILVGLLLNEMFWVIVFGHVPIATSL